MSPRIVCGGGAECTFARKEQHSSLTSFFSRELPMDARSEDKASRATVPRVDYGNSERGYVATHVQSAEKAVA